MVPSGARRIALPSTSVERTSDGPVPSLLLSPGNRRAGDVADRAERERDADDRRLQVDGSIRVDEDDALADGEGEVGDAGGEGAAEDRVVVEKRCDPFADLGDERLAPARFASASERLAGAEQQRGDDE